MAKSSFDRLHAVLAQFGFEEAQQLQLMLEQALREDPVIGYDEEQLPVRATVAMHLLLSEMQSLLASSPVDFMDFQKEATTW